MKKNFYRAFEDKYRGSRELIRSRLEVYLDFLMPLASASNLRRAVDLGCGRGEFLEVLSSANYNAQGVDLDDGMLAACYDLKLPAAKADALSFIESLHESSQSVVSAFHLVEHIQFEQLQSLVFQAHRILEPGGLLILETPNPENFIVATKNFYLDHTHQRPIPPELLGFIAEFHGFERVKILRLQESPSLHDASNISLNDIIGGASPDYAIVAQKNGPDSIMTALNSPFSKDYGITMDALVARYENLQFDIVRKAEQAEARATQAEARATQAEARATQAEARATQAEAQIVYLTASQSWKITAPLRSLNDFVRFHKKRGIRFYFKQFLRRFESFVRRQPALNLFVLKLLDAFPAIRKFLGSPKSGRVPKMSPQHDSSSETSNMSPRAQRIHADLKNAIERKKGKFRA